MTYIVFYITLFIYYRKIVKERIAGTNFVEYAIIDEYERKISGIANTFGKGKFLQHANLVLNCKAPFYPSKQRKILSFYYHSWDTLTLDVSVGVSTTLETGLNITPKKTDKYWKLASDVVFDF